MRRVLLFLVVTGWSGYNNAVAILRHSLRDNSGGGDITGENDEDLHPVNRIDKGVSGVWILARGYDHRRGDAHVEPRARGSQCVTVCLYVCFSCMRFDF